MLGEYLNNAGYAQYLDGWMVTGTYQVLDGPILNDINKSSPEYP